MLSQPTAWASVKEARGDQDAIPRSPCPVSAFVCLAATPNFLRLMTSYVKAGEVCGDESLSYASNL